jgi:hypothetical protein
VPQGQAYSKQAPTNDPVEDTSKKAHRTSGVTCVHAAGRAVGLLSRLIESTILIISAYRST